jgi:hypothetical protein
MLVERRDDENNHQHHGLNYIADDRADATGMGGVVYVARFSNALFRVGAAHDVESARATLAQTAGTGEIVWTKETPSLDAASWLARSPYFAFPVARGLDAVGSATLDEIIKRVEKLARFAGIETERPTSEA